MYRLLIDNDVCKFIVVTDRYRADNGTEKVTSREIPWSEVARIDALSV